MISCLSLSKYLINLFFSCTKEYGNNTWASEEYIEAFKQIDTDKCNSSNHGNGCSSPPSSNYTVSPESSSSPSSSSHLSSEPSTVPGNATAFPSSEPVSELRVDALIPAFIGTLDETANENLSNITIIILSEHGASTNLGTPVHDLRTHASSIMASKDQASVGEILAPLASTMETEDISAHETDLQSSSAKNSTNLRPSGNTILPKVPDVETTSGRAIYAMGSDTPTSTSVDIVKTVEVLSNQTLLNSELETSLETFMANYDCFAEFSIILYRERLDNLTEASKICLIESLCSLENENYDFTIGNLNVYWVKNMSENCYMEIFRDTEDKVSISGRVTEDLGFIILSPSCQQSSELAYVEFIGNKMSIFPGICRELLCNAGVSEVHSESLFATLIYPHITSNYDLVDSCQHILRTEMKDRAVSSSPGHTSIFLTSRFPRGSPCTTYTLFTVINTNSHLIIPFRSTWCRFMDRQLWRNFIADSYTGFMSESESKLYECIVEKKQKQRSKILDYGKFIRNLIGTSISIPEIPHPCVSVICDADVEIVNILQRNGEILQWFTHANYKRKRHLHVMKAKVMRCQRALSNGTQIDGYDNEALIFMPQSTSLENKPLILTVDFSCPDTGGAGEEESNILKSEILATLRLIQKDLPEICMSIICNATVEKLSNELISVSVSYNDNITQQCSNLATHMTAYAPKEYIFSFDEPQTGSSIVFQVQNFTEVSHHHTFLPSFTGEKMLNWQYVVLMCTKM
ncbi:uncharacterized protein [Palaemon carinicauda]|uniref:uncharacterized protein n=1 Tax=Palaemon carinicauda TaxID=392227 RepID=UPI0035B58684